MTAVERTRRGLSIVLLLTVPPTLLGIARVLDWVNDATARATIVGMAVAVVGGVVSGLVAERTLHRGRSELENVLGLIAVTTLGVLTIGYLYLAHIRGPMATIGDLSRTIRQGLSFLTFLSAEGAGILMALPPQPDRNRPSA